MDQKRLVIIDGYSLLYRAFFGTRYLSTSDGRPTNALYGLAHMVFTILSTIKPQAIVVVFDAPGKTFRHTEYAEYKATRKETHSDLKEQLPIARELIAAFGIPSLEMTGYEADDIIGTFSKQAEDHGYYTTIITGDQDAFQLIDDYVSVMTTRRGMSDVILYNPKAVVEKYGFAPQYIPDYKALTGDPSDNIPGIKGIGEKTASKLIQQFGNIENLIEKIEEVDPKLREKIEPNIKQLKTSKWLATIDREVPLHYDFAPYKVTPEHLEAARNMLTSLEFKSLLRRLDTVLQPYTTWNHATIQPPTITFEKIETQLDDEIKSLAKAKQFIGKQEFALYFTAPQPQESMFEEEPGGRAYIAIGKEIISVTYENGLKVLEEITPKAIIHDSKGLYKEAENAKLPLRFDTSIAAYLLQPERTSYALPELVQGYLGIVLDESPEQHAAAIYMLKEALEEKLEKEDLMRVFQKIELPLVPILASMEKVGICISNEMLHNFSKLLEVQMHQTAQLIYEIAEQEFLISSPKQLGEILFEKLGIPGGRKNKTGYATGVEVLQELAADYPICLEVLRWRELAKLKSTYADALPKLVGEDGRIHTTFNQTVTTTGRLSSTEPNLQNIPIRTELGRQIRKAFIAQHGYQLVSFDYSQIELRLLAHLSEDEALLKAFQHGEDIHIVTASLMFKVSKNKVDKKQRRLAKMLNYAVLYGISGYGLANQLGAEFGVSEATQLIHQYYDRFPKVKDFTQKIIAEARLKGYTTTLCGRRRFFPDINISNRTQRMYSERQAVNAPIQGSQADMIKLAMISASQLLEGRKTRLLLQVHDELLFEMPKGEEDLIEPIRKTMREALPLSVPIQVDVKVGSNWDEAAPWTEPGEILV